jgi:hypothetical protein
MKFATRTLLVCLCYSLLSGCTTYLYQGRITAKDSADIDREVIVSWSKTDPLIGAAKADTITLRTACGIPITFDEKDDGIFFFGIIGSDIPLATAATPEATIKCGQILGHHKVEEIGPGPLSLLINCRPQAGHFVGTQRQYLKARLEPYLFTVSESKEWSWLGKDIVLPLPVCHH